MCKSIKDCGCRSHIDHTSQRFENDDARLLFGVITSAIIIGFSLLSLALGWLIRFTLNQMGT